MNCDRVGTGRIGAGYGAGRAGITIARGPRHDLGFYFNAGGWNRKLNYSGWVPERYMIGGRLHEGMTRVMSMAGIGNGWLDGVKKAGGDFHLVDFIFAKIAQNVAERKVRQAAPKQRGNK